MKFFTIEFVYGKMVLWSAAVGTKKVPAEVVTFKFEKELFLNNLLVVLQDVFSGADLI